MRSTSRLFFIPGFLFAGILLVLSLAPKSAAAQVLPDVRVTDISWTPSNPVAGDTVTIQATISNASSADTPAGIPVGVGMRIDGAYVGSFFVRDSGGQTVPLAGWATYTGTFDATWTAVEGTHAVLAIADDIDRFPESNENNNDRTEPLSVVPPPLPDVVITDVSWTPANPTAGQAVTLHATVANIGNAATPTGVPVGVGIQVDGAWVGSFFVRNSGGQTVPLAVGTSYMGTATATWTAVAGAHPVRAIADDIDRFPESNENNNERTETLNAGPGALPDVTILSIELTPAAPQAGEQVTIRATLKNNADVPTPDGVPVGVGAQVDGQYLGSFFYLDSQGVAGPMPAHATFFGTIDATWTAVAGEHTIALFADDLDRFPESDEDNNELTIPLEVQNPTLGIPQLLAPLSDTTSLQPIFSWSAVPTATGHRLSVETAAGGTPVFTADVSLPATTHTPAQALEAGTCYRWTVRALRNGTVGAAAPAVDFCVLDASADFPRLVATEAALRDAILDYPVSGLSFGEIVILQDIALSGPLTITEAENLVIRGQIGPQGMPRLSSPTAQGGRGTLNVAPDGDLNQRVFRLTIKDLEIEIAPGSEHKGLWIGGEQQPTSAASGGGSGTELGQGAGASFGTVESVLVQGVTLVAAANNPPLPSVALQVENVESLVIDQVTIDTIDGRHHYGTGVRLSNVVDFAIIASRFANIRHGMENIIPAPDRRDGYALLIVNHAGVFQGTQRGLVRGNTFDHTASQTIYVANPNGLPLQDLVIEHNTLSHVGVQPVDCTGNCGGRGIYIHDGSNFLIRGNNIDTVAWGGTGGGIHAGNAAASHLVIDGNIIHNVGDMPGPQPGNTDNGYGIVVHGPAWVKNNRITASTNYGIRIIPGAHGVRLEGDIIEGSGFYGVQLRSTANGQPSLPISDITLLGTTIRNSQDEAVHLAGEFSGVSVRDLVLSGNDHPAVRATGPSAVGETGTSSLHLSPADPGCPRQGSYYEVADDVALDCGMPAPTPALVALEQALTSLTFPHPGNTGARSSAAEDPSGEKEK